jgi:type II secretory pathway pseudopilin PulG
VRDESAYSVVELLTAMSILAIILSGLVSVFVAGSNADADLNRRYQAQTDARIAMDKLRREVHRACNLATGYGSSSVTFYFPNSSGGCVSDTQTVSWCTSGSGTKYALLRIQAASCAGATAKFADFLTSGTVFTFTNGDATTHALARLRVDLNINRTPTRSVNAYHIVDDIAFRNFTRL